MRKFILSFIILSLALLLSCTKRINDAPVDMDSLASLQAMANNKSNKATRRQARGRIKEMGLRETALSVGAQAGLAWRSRMIDDQLVRLARRLDAIYDFNSLILEHNILPPVLLEGRNTLNLADPMTIRISDRTYKISKQARFVTTPPNWRQYLWLDFKRPDVPNSFLLPKTRREKQIWSYQVEQGWRNGIEQANNILEENIARIREDYLGMILYRKLLAMNMVSPPYVANTDLGITGDETEIHIDDKILRITALPGLNTNAKEWIAAVTKDQNALERFKHMEKLAKNSKLVITSKAWQPVIAPVN